MSVAEAPVVPAIHAVGGRGCLAGSLAGVDLDQVPLEVLERRLIAGWAEQSAHMARWLSVLAAFDRREGWGGLGYASCPHWLAVHCGISQSTGADHLRAARRLEHIEIVAWPEEAALIRLGMDYGRNEIYKERRGAAAAAAEASGGQPERVQAPSRVESLGWTVAAGVARLDADPNHQPPCPTWS